LGEDVAPRSLTTWMISAGVHTCSGRSFTAARISAAVPVPRLLRLGLGRLAAVPRPAAAALAPFGGGGGGWTPFATRARSTKRACVLRSAIWASMSFSIPSSFAADSLARTSMTGFDGTTPRVALTAAMEQRFV
jgi:hypothetical protein